MAVDDDVDDQSPRNCVAALRFELAIPGSAARGGADGACVRDHRT